MSKQMTRSKAIATTIKKRKMNFKVKDMRKRIFTTIAAVFMGSVSFAQDTTTAFGFLRSQMEVDAFDFTTVTGNLVITGSTITNLSNLSGLTSIGGNLDIKVNPNLTSLAGLGALTSVNDLIISTNPRLTNLSGLDNLTHVIFSAIINTNLTLTSLEGLEGLTTIETSSLGIYSNTVLSTLNGLNNLTTLGGRLFIGTSNGVTTDENPALTNFCAINQLVSGDNPQITTTEYFVANNGYNPTHAGLASGIVETATDENDGCAEFGTVLPVPVVVISTNTFSKEEEGYRLFPNPVKDVLFVKSESKITSITISNVSGQEVLKSNSASINVRNLSKGIYFARIVSGEKTVVEKFVKL